MPYRSSAASGWAAKITAVVTIWPHQKKIAKPIPISWTYRFLKFIMKLSQEFSLNTVLQY